MKKILTLGLTMCLASTLLIAEDTERKYKGKERLEKMKERQVQRNAKFKERLEAVDKDSSSKRYTKMVERNRKWNDKFDKKEERVAAKIKKREERKLNKTSSN